jgi:hypothetical protein
VASGVFRYFPFNAFFVQNSKCVHDGEVMSFHHPDLPHGSFLSYLPDIDETC